MVTVEQQQENAGQTSTAEGHVGECCGVLRHGVAATGNMVTRCESKARVHHMTEAPMGRVGCWQCWGWLWDPERGSGREGVPPGCVGGRQCRGQAVLT